MGNKRFAIPSQKLKRTWDFGPDWARVVECVAISDVEYGRAHFDVGSIYFIGDQMGGDPIKIGWSRDPVRRLQQIQVGNPATLKIIGCVAANRLIEPALHQLFATSAVSGEWFADPEGSLLAWLREMTFGRPIGACRWLTAGTANVTWQWSDKAQRHVPLFTDETN